MTPLDSPGPKTGGYDMGYVQTACNYLLRGLSYG